MVDSGGYITGTPQYFADFAVGTSDSKLDRHEEEGREAYSWAGSCRGYCQPAQDLALGSNKDQEEAINCQEGNSLGAHDA